MDHVETLRHVLHHVHRAFERHGIWHCLAFGSLLGAVRDGDVIAWDHDVDIVVRPVDLPAILALNSELAEDGFHIWHGRMPGSRLGLNPGHVPWFDPGYVSIMMGDTPYGELWAPSLFSDGVLRYYDFESEVSLFPHFAFAAWFVEDLDTAEIDGVPYPVPAHARELLRWTYGEDWSVPYRAVIDGGEPREGSTIHGDLAVPDLAGQLAWCEAQGWDRSRYALQPAWPRRPRSAGPSLPPDRFAQQ
jgi:hypothetical protein